MASAACDGVPMPGIDDQRDVGEIGAQRLQRVFVDEAARRADRRGPRHQHGAAGGDQALGRAQIFGRVGQHLEALGAERGRGLDQAEQIGLQGVVIGDDFELDPVRAEQLARHVRRGDRFLGRAAAGGVGQHAAAELLDQRPEALAGARRAPTSRLSETVTISAPEASTACFRLSGEGYCAVPSSSREVKSVAVKGEHQPPCLGATISISSARRKRGRAARGGGDEAAVHGRGDLRFGKAEPRAKLVERRRLGGERLTVEQDLQRNTSGSVAPVSTKAATSSASTGASRKPCR